MSSSEKKYLLILCFIAFLLLQEQSVRDLLGYPNFPNYPTKEQTKFNTTAAMIRHSLGSEVSVSDSIVVAVVNTPQSGKTEAVASNKWVGHNTFQALQSAILPVNNKVDEGSVENHNGETESALAMVAHQDNNADTLKMPGLEGSNLDGTVVAIINTVKSGTESLVGTFSRSWRPCTESSSAKITTNQCGNNYIVRTRDTEEARDYLRTTRSENPDIQCLVVTAVRNPRTSIPSMFFDNRNYCEPDSSEYVGDNVSREAILDDYIDWLEGPLGVGQIANGISSVIPKLMYDIYDTSITEEFRKMDETRDSVRRIIPKSGPGFSLISPPAKLQSSDDGFAGCDMLFLRVEDSEAWPSIIQSFFPGAIYHLGKSRRDICPAMSEHYTTLQNYDISYKQIARLISVNAYVDELFRAYDSA